MIKKMQKNVNFDVPLEDHSIIWGLRMERTLQAPPAAQLPRAPSDLALSASRDGAPQLGLLVVAR